MSIVLNAEPLTRNWSFDETAALCRAADEYPREIGESSMLDLIVETEGLGRTVIVH